MWLESRVPECCSQSTAENNKNHTDPSHIQSTETKQSPCYQLLMQTSLLSCFLDPCNQEFFDTLT